MSDDETQRLATIVRTMWQPIRLQFLTLDPTQVDIDEWALGYVQGFMTGVLRRLDETKNPVRAAQLAQLSYRALFGDAHGTRQWERGRALRHSEVFLQGLDHGAEEALRWLQAKKSPAGLLEHLNK
jgi:hypothetical protein